jgi:HD-GYP domain-containing protein (c-di-GMP phosphodiesterase class II)
VLIGDDLLVDEQVVRRTNLSLQGLIALLKRRGVERITLAVGLEIDEAERFVATLAAGDPPQSSTHIIVGRAHIAIVDETKPQERRKLSVDQVETARDAWARFRVERKLPVDQMEQLVWSLIDSLAGTSRAMLPLAPLRQHDEYTFLHSVNVSLLVLLQARSFGIWGPMLHTFGMAALLHDIGKLSVPLSVLNKPGKLDDAEWAS